MVWWCFDIFHIALVNFNIHLIIIFDSKMIIRNNKGGKSVPFVPTEFFISIANRAVSDREYG